MKIAKILSVLFAFVLVGAAGLAMAVYSYSQTLPQMIKVDDYKPLLVTQVFARGGEKIGEYYRENRTVLPYDKIPKRLIQAFLAAEDDTFFQHGGINYIAIMRAGLVNLISGEKKQGASTITQQVARAMLLSSEKTYTRKIKEVLLSYRMEANLSKEEILYLYLNQIFFGEKAYGVAAAADTYFHKSVDQLTLAEMAILGGLPKAPSNYSPTQHPKEAKNRQRYVLERMAKVGFITEEERKVALGESVTVYYSKESKVAPYFVETLRQLLIQALGEKAVLDEGLRVYTSVDYKAQQLAVEQVQAGLRDIDKREGYRGPAAHIANQQDLEKFLLTTRKNLRAEQADMRIIKPDGNLVPDQPLTIYHQKDAAGKVIANIPPYIKKDQLVDGVVTKIDDQLGLVYVRFAEGLGLMDVGDMGWARKPDSSVKYENAPRIQKASTILKPGDIILVKVAAEKFTSMRLEGLANPKTKKAARKPVAGLPDFNDYAYLTLDQLPVVEGALLSFDQKSSEVIAMVGGYEWIHKKNEFNRTLQAKRQTGSSFKTIVYASALDRGYSPATPIQDSPVVFETKTDEGQEGGEDDIKTWKPHNHGQKFVGDILFRMALIRSLNIPTVKILENVGIPWVMDYAKRLGVFSPLNNDLSLGLGSSSLTLYEMTKVFSEFGRLGQRVHPLVVHKVVDKDGKTILENLTLDKRFEKDETDIAKNFEDRRKTVLEDEAKATPAPVPVAGETPGPTPRPKIPNIFFQDPDQLISPQTAYVTTTLLSGVINDEGGTAARARALGRPAAGKTGSTNGYYDGWFVGYTPQVVTGVWVGFDGERSIGLGEEGSRTALPIWLEYMKAVHKDLPILDFQVPTGVVFANIDNLTGKLASASSTAVVRQAFIQGTEPKEATGGPTRDDETDFLKKDLSE